MNHKKAQLLNCPQKLHRFWPLGVIIISTVIVGCSTIMTPRDDTGSSGGGLIIPSNFDQALIDNQKALTQNKAQPDIALYNVGVLSVHPANPKKDYFKAMASFKDLVKQYPSSARAEPAKLWLQAIEQYQQNLEDAQKLADEKRTIARERDQLAQERLQLIQERNKLNYALEKSRQLDADIEKRRKQVRKR